MFYIINQHWELYSKHETRDKAQERLEVVQNQQLAHNLACHFDSDFMDDSELRVVSKHRYDERKRKNKLESWRRWENGMKLLREIHKDIRQKFKAQQIASDWVFREGKFNG